MPTLGNAAKFGIGATPNYIASGKTINWTPGKAVIVKTDIIDEVVPAIIDGGSRENSTIKISVARNKGDTNGQAALNTAFKAGTQVQFTLAPEGTTAGSEKITGSARVDDIGSITMEKNVVIMRDISLIVSGDYTEGVFP